MTPYDAAAEAQTWSGSVPTEDPGEKPAEDGGYATDGTGRPSGN